MASVVGKTIFSDGKGKLFFGYYKDNDAVEFVDYKTWKKLNFKDVSKGDTNKEGVIKAIVKNQKQFNKKVDFNMWAKKQKRSFEDTMDWFIKNGWISNITKRGIKEGVEDVLSVNEGKYDDMLKDGDGHIHFVVKNLKIADELADKIEDKHLGDTDIYKDKGKSYLRVALSVGYSGKEVSNIKKIEKIVGMRAKAGSPEIWAADDLNEAYVVTYAKKKGEKPASAAFSLRGSALSFERDLKKDGYITMVTQKKVKGVDEASLSKLHTAAKKGSYPITIVVIQKGKVVHQETVSTPQAVPAAFNVLRKKYSSSDYRFSIEDRTGKVLHKEAMVSPRRGHEYFQLTKDTPIKYIESSFSNTNAPGVLLHNKDGYIKGKKGGYLIDYFKALFYVDLKNKFALKVYPLKDQDDLKYNSNFKEVDKAPEYSDWKKFMKESVNELNTKTYRSAVEKGLERGDDKGREIARKAIELMGKSLSKELKDVVLTIKPLKVNDFHSSHFSAKPPMTGQYQIKFTGAGNLHKPDLNLDTKDITLFVKGELGQAKEYGGFGGPVELDRYIGWKPVTLQLSIRNGSVEVYSYRGGGGLQFTRQGARLIAKIAKEINLSMGGDGNVKHNKIKQFTPHKNESVNESANDISKITKAAKSEKAFYDILDTMEKKYGKRGFDVWLDKSLKDLKINPRKFNTSAEKQEQLFQATLKK